MVQMPKQPFPSGPLGPGWHDYLAEIERQQETIASLTSRVSALEAPGGEEGEAGVARSDLASGFGRILIDGPQRTLFTSNFTISTSARSPSFDPAADTGDEFHNAPLPVATVAGSKQRVTIQGAAFDNTGVTNRLLPPAFMFAVFLDGTLADIIHSHTAIWDTSNRVGVVAKGSFWADSGQTLNIRTYNTSGYTLYFNSQNAGASAGTQNGNFPCYVETEEWAVI